MNIRLEKPEDYFKVENMVRNSFWNIYRPGAYEHYIVHRLRDDESFIRDLAYVIEIDGKIIGHINYSKGKISFNNGEFIEAIVLGPIAIDKDWQNNGYGSELIQFTLNLLDERNVAHVFVVGDENYYSRFGFESASKYGVYLEGTDKSDECPFFMIRILDDDTNLEEGTLTISDAFGVAQEDVDEFDRKFEPKEKRVCEGQL